MLARQKADVSQPIRTPLGFLYLTPPTEAITQLGLYEESIGDFSRFNEIVMHTERYWSIMSKSNPELSEFALKLADIPAIMPEINFRKIRKVTPNYEDKPEYQKFAITLIANEKPNI